MQIFHLVMYISAQPIASDVHVADSYLALGDLLCSFTAVGSSDRGLPRRAPPNEVAGREPPSELPLSLLPLFDRPTTSS
ncbi:hypothetical protein CRG98_040201 [Punica granatum]|uniref:Uncharacterized protein n=1 Tax=Punica granatum TaxID=22663 RepID=A0A2I0I6K6_PUNGR|nr:hypothetical protein CRG98_040201 [Punica granatum]